MVKLPTKFMLFVSSYSPLFLITAFISLSDHIIIKFSKPYLSFINFNLLDISILLSIFFLILSLVSIAWTLHFIKIHKNVGTEPSPKIENIQKKDTDIMAYIATYLIPFMNLDFNNILLTISFLFFIVLVGYIYIFSNLFYINPIFNIMGYHIYEIEIKNGKYTNSKILISYRKDDIIGNVLNVITIDNDIYLELKK